MFIYKSRLRCDDFTSRDKDYAERYLAELEEEYRELVKMEIPQLTERDFGEFNRTGRRIGYENKYFLRRTMLRDFALKTWLGDKNAIEPLEKIIAAVCGEFTWALPAHIGDNKPRTVIDLFAAETAQTLCEIISLMGDMLSDEIKTKAIGEVKSRVLKPFTERTQKYGWEQAKSNWSVVCGGSVGMAILYLAEDKIECKKILAPLERAFEYYMESFTEDGACLEGLYYWGYGMTYLTAFLDLYEDRMGEQFPVNYKKLAKMAEFAHKCCIEGGVTVSFSDGGEKDRIYAGLSSKLTQAFYAPSIPDEYKAYFYGDECGRWCRAARDIAWTNKPIKKPLPHMSVLPDAQWAVVRGNEMSFAVKGGTNGEPHNHNDIGSFIVVKNGSVIFCDLGAGEYTREYFSKDRYDILCCSSTGHSVPIIDSEPQSTGVEYAGAGFAADKFSVSVDISGAYGLEILKKCVRKIEYTDGKVVLTDKFEFTKPTMVTERFITRDAKAALCLETDKKYRTEASTYKHREHDGKVTDITAIDYIFEADGEIKFMITIH